MNKKVVSVSIIILLTICLLVLVLVKDMKEKNNRKIDSIKELYYSTSGGSYINSNTIYEIKCNNDGCVLKSKLPNYNQDDLIEVNISKKDMDEIVNIVNKYEVMDWDGFNKSDKGVMDGSSFSFSIKSGEGKNMSAYGYMIYPKNYRIVINRLKSIFDRVNKEVYTNLFDNKYYDGFDINNVSKVEYSRISIAGIDKQDITDKNEIIKIYDKWNNTKITIENKMTCEDNGYTYRFIMNDGKDYDIKVECYSLIIGDKRYYYSNSRK